MIEKYYTRYAPFSPYVYINDVLPPEHQREEFNGDTVDGAIAHRSESWKYIESLGLDYKVALAYVEKMADLQKKLYEHQLEKVNRRFSESVYVIAEIRADQKKNKNYEAADALRSILLGLGFEVRDSKDGTYELKYVET